MFLSVSSVCISKYLCCNFMPNDDAGILSSLYRLSTGLYDSDLITKFVGPFGEQYQFLHLKEQRL